MAATTATRSSKYNSKAYKRASVAELTGMCRWAESQMRFWFMHRHDWSPENGGYDFCRQRFVKAKQDRKAYQRLLANAAARYCKDYRQAAPLLNYPNG